MRDLLWFPISFLGAVAAYTLFDRRSTKEEFSSVRATSAMPVSGDSALFSVQIMEATSTNNSYDPMGDVLASLDFPQVQELLEGKLNASMEGYMS